MPLQFTLEDVTRCLLMQREIGFDQAMLLLSLLRGHYPHPRKATANQDLSPLVAAGLIKVDRYKLSKPPKPVPALTKDGELFAQWLEEVTAEAMSTKPAPSGTKAAPTA